MKTIGLLGGMSWESTTSYYQAINQGIKAQLGGLHSAQIRMHSLDFAEIAALQQAGDWPKMTRILTAAALSVQDAGADGLLICTNTMHKIAEDIADELAIPLLHIADATGAQLVDDGIKKVGLLGTRFTMEQPFYADRIKDTFAVEVITPSEADRADVHRIIYDELCVGKIRSCSRDTYLKIIDRLVEQGADAVILGCTEIALLVDKSHTDVALYDTTQLHANAAVKFALQDELGHN